MINISLVENKTYSNGKKKGIERRIAQIKKPKTLSDFKTFLLSEFNTDKPYYITIYLIDSNGETNEIKDEEEYEDKDSVAFKVVYDESNPKPSEDDIKSIKSEDNDNDKDRESINNISLDSIDENKLTLLLDQELKDDIKEEYKFDSNILLDDYLKKQEELVQKTKLKINEDIENIMVEKSAIFTDLKNIPQIQESIIGTTKKIIEISNINKTLLMRQKKEEIEEEKQEEKKEEKQVEKKEIIKKIDNINIEEVESDDEDDQQNIKFMKEDISLTQTVKESKWIKIENINFQNISNKVFAGGDLFFYKGEESSKEFNFIINLPNQDNKKQDICLEDDLKNLDISKGHELLLRIESPSINKKYIFYVYIKSEKYKIRTIKPLKIEVTIINENQINEKAEEERIEKERIEREEREAKEKEEEEKKIEEEKREKERMEAKRKEKERLEREAKEKKEKERLEKEAKGKEEKERIEREAKEKEEKEREEKEGGGNNDDEEEAKIQEIFDKLEEEYYITTFLQEEDVKKKIKELNRNEEDIIQWVNSVM